ncbi:MAG: hypothetical protein AAGD05_10110, partial [Bacteroidota bacterium]
MKNIAIYALLIWCSIPFDLSARIFTAIDTGDWDDAAIWDQNSIPGAADTVVIDGFQVTISGTGNYTISAVEIYNNINNSKLKQDGENTLTITGDLIVTANDVKKYGKVELKGGSTLYVQGNASFIRSADNDQDSELSLKINENSHCYITGHFFFDYNNSGAKEDHKDIYLNSGNLDVTGNAYIYVRDGGSDGLAFNFTLKSISTAIFRSHLFLEIYGGTLVDFILQDSAHLEVLGNLNILRTGGTRDAKIVLDSYRARLTVHGNLSMNSTQSNRNIFIEAKSDDAIIRTKSDVILDAVDEDDV